MLRSCELDLLHLIFQACQAVVAVVGFSLAHVRQRSAVEEGPEFILGFFLVELAFVVGLHIVSAFVVIVRVLPPVYVYVVAVAVAAAAAHCMSVIAAEVVTRKIKAGAIRA